MDSGGEAGLAGSWLAQPTPLLLQGGLRHAPDLVLMALPPNFSSLRVAKVQPWSYGLRTVTLDYIPEPFVAGQFFQLALEVDGAPLKRSYSAASAPGAPLEFFLSLVENGALTPGLFALEPGHELGVDPKALGFFTLREVPEAKVLWLVATGTGLGPYISMLRNRKDLERFEKILVVHGARTHGQLAYAAELRGFALADPRVRYLPLSSRDEAPADGLTGRITTALSSGALEEKAGVAIDQDAHVLFCGNPQMIEDMTALLKERGLRKHKRREPGHYNFEKYW